ncbi:MAG: hypothetical protein ABEL97_03130 [Salinibacter sp.]
MPLEAARLGALWAAALILLGTVGFPSRSVEPVTAPWVAASVAPASDTLRAEVAAGRSLIQALPAEVGGTPVTGYAVLRGPALCGVAGRSFTWITRGTAPGTYDVRLRAAHPGTAPDTLVLRIDVRS